MDYIDPTARQRAVLDRLERAVSQCEAAALPPDMVLELPTALAAGARLVQRADLGDADPEFGARVSRALVALGRLAAGHGKQIAAAAQGPVPSAELTESLNAVVSAAEPPPRAPPQPELASRYLQLRDQLELLREGLGQLGLVCEALQLPLALADERLHQHLGCFAGAGAFADLYMAELGVDPNPGGPYGFWPAVADAQDAGAAGRRAGALLTRAACAQDDEVTARLVQSARGRGAPPELLRRLLERDELQRVQRVVATLVLAAALRPRGQIQAAAALQGEVEALPDPRDTLLLGAVPALGLELRCLQQPGEVRLVLYTPRSEQLEQIHCQQVSGWQRFPGGVVGRVPITADDNHPPRHSPTALHVRADYAGEAVGFVVTLRGGSPD